MARSEEMVVSRMSTSPAPVSVEKAFPALVGPGDENASQGFARMMRQLEGCIAFLKLGEEVIGQRKPAMLHTLEAYKTARKLAAKCHGAIVDIVPFLQPLSEKWVEQNLPAAELKFIGQVNGFAEHFLSKIGILAVNIPVPVPAGFPGSPEYDDAVKRGAEINAALKKLSAALVKFRAFLLDPATALHLDEQTRVKNIAVARKAFLEKEIAGLQSSLLRLDNLRNDTAKVLKHHQDELTNMDQLSPIPNEPGSAE